LSFSQISIVNIKNDQIKYAKGKRACALAHAANHVPVNQMGVIFWAFIVLIGR